MKRRIHPWAIGVTAVVILVPVAFVLLALIAVRSDRNLVTDDYYEKDLRYQDRIDALRRARALLVKPVIEYDASSPACTVQFPDSAHWTPIRGSIRLYRSADRRSDREVPLQLDRQASQTLPTRSMEKGLWLVQLSWKVRDLDYYLEERVFIR